MAQRHLFTTITLLVLIAASFGCGGAAANADRDIAAARAVLDAQMAAWNRGDVTGYMEGYAKLDATTFVSGDTVTRGWQTVLERYKRHYDTRDKMGTLAFTELEFKPLDDAHILAMGRWQLTRTGDNPHGRFTLIFSRTGAGWRIVHDHTSSAQ